MGNLNIKKWWIFQFQVSQRAALIVVSTIFVYDFPMVFTTFRYNHHYGIYNY